MRQVLRIGSRGSKLALWQAEHIKSLIATKFPDIEIQLIPIKTTGDRLLDSPLSEIGGKGVFIKEIEDALLRDRIDIAVHSMKDLPVILPEGLRIGAVAKRDDPRDALISNGGVSFKRLKRGARIGTGSLRRKTQLLNHSPDLEIVPIRGNVDTRLRKLQNGEFDAIILAMAGMGRMGLIDEVTEAFPIDFLIPAPGQGIIAVESRESDTEINDLIKEINHYETEIASVAERSFLEAIGGDCNIPAGCYASVIDDRMKIIGFVASPDGKDMIREETEGSKINHQSLGKEVAKEILESGGEKIASAINR
ncbi:hydroxymethylbilane synthase [Desulfobacterota bacterium AH_259_B03_O07]|nr:hydroxymethylbilane synthase [Desulfobacterota bacterium AH_259_B03_O07]